MAVNNGSAEPAYYVDRLQRVQVQQQHCQQAIRYTVQPSHVSAPGKEILEPARRDLVYVHCATTEEEEDAEEEEEEPKGLTRSRSWLCCPADHSSDRTVPIQVEAGHKRQESVSWTNFLRPSFDPTCLHSYSHITLALSSISSFLSIGGIIFEFTIIEGGCIGWQESAKKKRGMETSMGRVIERVNETREQGLPPEANTVPTPDNGVP